MNVLEARGLTKHYPAPPRAADPGPVRAAQDVTLAVAPGEVLALVGESGCGKSTVAGMLVGLISPTAGQVAVAGRELGVRRARADRRLVQLVTQNPRAALNRRHTIGHALHQPLRVHGIGEGRRDRQRAVDAMVERVGLSPEHLAQRPGDVSGGELARVVLARALLPAPAVVVLDEPTASLDVSVKATVVNLLLDLRAELDLALLLITHELPIAHHLADAVAVMHQGHLVETGPIDQVFGHPQHDHTRELLASVLTADPRQRLRPAATGSVPHTQGVEPANDQSPLAASPRSAAGSPAAST